MSDEQETLEQTIARIEAGDAMRDTDEVVTLVAEKRPLDKLVPVRLTDEQYRQLRASAQRMGVGPSTLGRIWILEKLREAQPARESA
jgi:hypothetical protein